MKTIRRQSREGFHLTLTVTLTTLLTASYILINVFEEVNGFLAGYLGIPHTITIFHLVLAYLTVLIWILYRRWTVALKGQNELKDIISGINTDVLLVTDKEDRIIRCNTAVQRMLGYTSEELIDQRTIRSLIIPAPRPPRKQSPEADRDKYRTEEVTARKKNGEAVSLEVIEGDLRQSQGRVYLLRDISERKTAERSLMELTQELEATNQALQKLVKTDPLTGLMNRRGLEEQLTREINRAQHEGWSIAAILLDCDGFKQINDTLGHAVGDAVLKSIGKNLKNALRRSDPIARVGGDEFLILLPGNRLAEALSVSERLRLAVATSPLPLSCESVRVTASLGVAMLAYETSSVEEILSLARQPLQRSKQNGKNLVSAAGDDASRHYPVRAAADTVERLLQESPFYAASQPIFNLQDQTLAGYELYGRCTVAGLEMPAEFFGFSMENNILSYVDLKCLKTCIAATDSLHPKAPFHVNLFPSTLLTTPIENLLKIFPKQASPGSFCVEISEQQFIGDPSYFKECVRALKEHGILVALDDLGFGRSSLESLILLEPDLIKIDRGYVHGVSHDKAKRRSLDRMLKVLMGLRVTHVAEGIETREDLEVLRDMGVAYGQGYLWGKPVAVPPSMRERPAYGPKQPSPRPAEPVHEAV